VAAVVEHVLVFYDLHSQRICIRGCFNQFQVLRHDRILRDGLIDLGAQNIDVDIRLVIYNQLEGLAERNAVDGFIVCETAGFSLHAGVATKANERTKLERLCRYITRPAVSTTRLSLTRNGQVRYELKTP